MGSHRRAACPIRARVCIQATGSPARATIAHQIWFWVKSCSGRLARPLSPDVQVSTDPELEGEIRDVVGLYLHPPAMAVVLCVDEKPQIEALERTARTLPVRPRCGPAIPRRLA